MKDRTDSRAVFGATRRALDLVRPAARPHAPYDLAYVGVGGPVYVLARGLNGRVGVTVREPRHAALNACGLAAYWVADALVPLSDLVGVAHVHAHHLDARVRSVVFRVIDGRPAPPRFCLGKCEGVLR